MAELSLARTMSLSTFASFTRGGLPEAQAPARSNRERTDTEASFHVVLFFCMTVILHVDEIMKLFEQPVKIQATFIRITMLYQ
jgi:hypothetical protein